MGINKLYFLSKKATLSRKIYELQKEIIILSKRYISENREFRDGELVKLINLDNNEEHLVFIYSCGIHDDGTLYYPVRKQKLDGTMSNHRFDYSNILDYKLEKL